MILFHHSCFCLFCVCMLSLSLCFSVCDCNLSVAWSMLRLAMLWFCSHVVFECLCFLLHCVHKAYDFKFLQAPCSKLLCVLGELYRPHLMGSANSAFNCEFILCIEKLRIHSWKLRIHNAIRWGLYQQDIDLRTFPVDYAWTVLIIFILRDPHFLKCRQRR